MVDVATVWPDATGINEDVYYSHILLYSRYRVAPVEVARRFASEQLPSDDPAGAHQLSYGVAESHPWTTFERMITFHQERLLKISTERQDAADRARFCPPAP
jgi:hypothetical protein